jgi:general stress protein YciG
MIQMNIQMNLRSSFPFFLSVAYDLRYMKSAIALRTRADQVVVTVDLTRFVALNVPAASAVRPGFAGQGDQAMSDRDKSERGFASMDEEQQREIASKGGRAAHESGNAHEFDSEEAREAGRKGGETVSRDREHMAEIGRKGGESGGGNRGGGNRGGGQG